VPSGCISRQLKVGLQADSVNAMASSAADQRHPGEYSKRNSGKVEAAAAPPGVAHNPLHERSGWYPHT
jgi:hypothetical protein